MIVPTSHSVTPQTNIDTSDVNQFLSFQGFDIVYRGAPFQQANTDVSFFLNWTQLPSNEIYAVAQKISLGSTLSISGIQIPVSYQGISADALDFSSPCDLKVSIQTDSGTGPSGTVIASTTIPSSLIDALSSSLWVEPQSMMIGQSSVSQFSMLPVATFSSSLSEAWNTSSSVINVASTANFPSSGTAVISRGASSAVVTYAATTPTSITGVAIVQETTSSFVAGSLISMNLSTSFAYIVAGQYLLAANCFDVGENVVYIAPYFGAGALGQWVSNSPLPEYDCSIVYSPSSNSLFAVGPSGAFYQASFDSTTGIVGTWQVQQLTDPSNVNTSLPAYNVATGDAPPALVVATIDAVDYVFIIGGRSNSVDQTTVLWLSVDDGGSLSSTTVSDALTCSVYVKQGLSAFFNENSIYVADANALASGTVNLYAIPVWVDSSGIFNSGTWTFVGSIESLSSSPPAQAIVFGVANDNVITTAGCTGLTTNGYGISQITNLWQTATFLTPVLSLGSGAVFENDDGSASAVFSSSLVFPCYPVTWLTVPLPCSLAIDSYYVVLETSLPQRTNFGVNVPLVGVYSSFIENYQYLDQYGWHVSSGGPVVIPFNLFANGGDFPLAIVETDGQRWSYLWYDNPQNLLITAIEVTFDVEQDSAVVGIAILNYDGLGGKNGTSPTLVSATEIT